MPLLQSLDVWLFCLLNQTLNHPVLDRVMPFFSGNALFIPAVMALATGLLWKGGRRGRVFVCVLAVLLMLGDGFVVAMLKEAVGRLRPFHDVPGTRLLTGMGRSYGMPSSHAATWFAASLLAFIYYRGSWRFMLPIACLVGFSRIYLGVHYPGDVLAGACLGAGYAAAGLWGLNALWQRVGRAWFPLWWRQMPSLAQPGAEAADGNEPRDAPATTLDQHWLRLGYGLIVVLLLARLGYLAGGRIELTKDEAYQWLWSKHLALSYYSKPPLIAYLQFLGTSLWGDTEFGVRFCSPVIAALLSVLLLRFMARTVHAHAALALMLVTQCTPLLAVGSVLMTIDPPLVLFWCLALVAGWRAVQPDGATRHWLWVGLWMGLGFLSKYAAAFQLVCFGCFFALWPPARPHLRRLGPYLALAIMGVCTLPVILWNAQHDWVTLGHLADNARRTGGWQPTLRFVGEFLVTQAGLQNPVFFVAMLGAVAAFWRHGRRVPLSLFLLSMGAPVFFGYLAFAFYKRVFPNWVAPAVVPLFCLAVVFWYGRWREGARAVRSWATAGLVLGGTLVVLLHEPRVIEKLVGRPLPSPLDPVRRARAWKETATTVDEVRARLQAEGPTAFIISHHYGLVGQLSFYLPEAKGAVRTQPLVYYRTSEQPDNQFYFWPGYAASRRGQNAIFVRELGAPTLVKGWWPKWLSGSRDLIEPETDTEPVARQVLKEFESVRDLGVRPVLHRGQVYRWLQLYECRNLR